MKLSRKSLFLFLLPFAILVACSENGAQAGGSSEPPEITISVEGAAAGDVLLVANIADQQLIQDTAQLAEVGGTAVFSRERPYPQGLYLAYYSDKTAIQFLIDEDQHFSLVTKKSDLYKSMTVEGSLANELFYDNRRFEIDLQPKLEAASARIKSLTEGSPEYAAAEEAQEKLIESRKQHLAEVFSNYPDNLYVRFKKAGQNPDVRTDLVLPDGSPDNTAQIQAYRKDFWNDVDFKDTVLLRTPVISNKLKRYMEQLTPQNAEAIIESADYLMEKVLDSPQYLRYFANWITLKYEPGETTLMDGEAVYVNMIRKYFTPELAFWSDSMTIYGLQQRAGEMAQSLTGQAGPNITVNDINGVPRALYDETAPYVIVFMYNPTCDHCIEQTPKVLNFVRNRPAGEVGLYAIAIDTDAAAWKKFVEKYNMQAYTNVFDPTNRSIYKTYYVDHTPELYLLNPERKIIGKNLKASQIATVIERDRAE